MTYASLLIAIKLHRMIQLKTKGWLFYFCHYAFTFLFQDLFHKNETHIRSPTWWSYPTWICSTRMRAPFYMFNYYQGQYKYIILIHDDFSAAVMHNLNILFSIWNLDVIAMSTTLVLNSNGAKLPPLLKWFQIHSLDLALIISLRLSIVKILFLTTSILWLWS